jgi:hypothetical protein
MGFFDTSGQDADVYSGTTNNAAADYDRLSASNPGQFSSDGIFKRLFGGANKKDVQQAALEASTGMPTVADPTTVNPAPDAPKTPANPTATTTASTEPSSDIYNPPTELSAAHASPLSSGPGLVKTISNLLNGPASHNGNGEPLVPGTQLTMPEFLKKLQQGQNSLAPPQAGMQAPPPAQSPYGNQRHGGNTFGGNTFGGNTFGGGKFGASAPGTAPAPAPQQGGAPAPQGPGIPIMQQPLQQARPSALPPGLGYFRGGALRMMRGGYPPLEMGMPQRHAHEGPVPSDGQGDGRSDHVDARLSPGEFVMDAETVALLGNGDSDAGARELEHMRQNIRKQKGQALAKGHFSPDAKAPGAYLKGRS